MSKSIEVWVIERDKALETRDVNKLIEYLEKWTEKGLYEKEMLEQFKNADDKVKLGSMCKMIMNWVLFGILEKAVAQ